MKKKIFSIKQSKLHLLFLAFRRAFLHTVSLIFFPISSHDSNFQILSTTKQTTSCVFIQIIKSEVIFKTF